MFKALQWNLSVFLDSWLGIYYNLEELLPKDRRLFTHIAWKDLSPNFPPLTWSLAPDRFQDYYVEPTFLWFIFSFKKHTHTAGTALSISNIFYFYPPTQLHVATKSRTHITMTALVRRQVSVAIWESLKFNGHNIFFFYHLICHTFFLVSLSCQLFHLDFNPLSYILSIKFFDQWISGILIIFS